MTQPPKQRVMRIITLGPLGLERLFPTGLDFLKLRYLAEHAESTVRLKLVEDEGLRPDLERLVGEVFVGELFAAHQAYGVALAITEPREAPPKPSLVEPLRTLTHAISSYALQVIAFAGLDLENNLVLARRALKPIDRVRRALAHRSGGAGPDESVEPGEPDEASEAVGPDESGEPGEPSEPDEASAAAEPGGPAEPDEPSEPIEPADERSSAQG